MRLRAAAGQPGPSEPGKSPSELALAKAAAPRTPQGEMLQYYLAQQPQLFHAIVEDQLAKLQAEREASGADTSAPASSDASKDSLDLVLSSRIAEVRAKEARGRVEEIMYYSILSKFVGAGVEMLPKMDGVVGVNPLNLKTLTEGIHTKEALELVREHLLAMMGPSADASFSNALIKISKLQMAQVYAASVMFGYFVRRVRAAAVQPRCGWLFIAELCARLCVFLILLSLLRLLGLFSSEPMWITV